TQLLSAFNDNLFKNAVVIWISATQASLFGVAPASMISLCSAVFIAPFFMFSATAGQLADRYEKTQVVRAVKAAEIAIMLLAGAGFVLHMLALLLAALFLMGVHSAFLGPVKYSILPQLVGPDELVEGNALVETGTFLAILVGTIGGGMLVLLPNGPGYVAGAVSLTSVAGFAMSLRMPRLGSGDASVRIHRNPLTPTWQIIGIVRRTRAVFLSVLGISWFWFFGAVLLSVLPVYARDALHAHEHVVTLFLCVFCVGIAVGSMLTERISGKNLELGLVPFGSIGITLFTLDLYFVGSPASHPEALLGVREFFALPHAYRILIDLFGMALSGGFFTVPLYTLIQQRAEPSERSRVVAGNNILNALFMAVGAALLAELFALGVHVTQMFLILAALSALTAVYIYSLLPEFLIRFFAFLIGRVMYRLEVRGHENIPETGGVVLVCNHVAFNDWLIVAGSVRRPVRFVMDHRMAGTPVISTLFKHGKTIPIAPEHENKAVLEAAFDKIAEELRAGEIVCIYPEGKITKTGEMNTFKAGIERILKETPVPVVPMALDGLWGSFFSRKGGPAMQHLPRRFRAKLRLTIDKPIPPEQASAARLEAHVRTLLEQTRALSSADARVAPRAST
ncbi:MAG: Glycerol acyltransferase, partial [Myxococcaceae bacterium]|nr:Glycerol acyltransferase [Myxococcaceae bacterium]